ncbi:hypothetical protein AGLY_005795 [Aphis glycines]|uniref:Uncharacterized protein n=1 Tax=Aphis glycines TaxID=307491 RepID=A0A6G0TSF9_APHGL|nr:hypothetical protein AGLY_005795 [Aphis glycines]
MVTVDGRRLATGGRRSRGRGRSCCSRRGGRRLLEPQRGGGQQPFRQAGGRGSSAPGDGGPPAGVIVVVDDDDDELFSDATAAIAAAAAAVGLGSNSSGGGGGDRSSAQHGSDAAVGGVDDARLPGSGSGLSALRLPPLKLPVSDDGSCEHGNWINIRYRLDIQTAMVGEFLIKEAAVQKRKTNYYRQYSNDNDCHYGVAIV